MKRNSKNLMIKKMFFLLILLFSISIYSQESQAKKDEPKSEFWSNVQFGGGFALGFGNGFTNIGVSPIAIYNFNQHFAIGTGLQYSFLKEKGFYSSNMYGGSIVGLINPLQEVQLSVELEQLRVNLNFVDPAYKSNDFWNTGLFLGAGYRMENITAGIRYNMLFDKDKGVYGDALMPFVRIFF
jgi:hypothetical protein